ncbi:MAG: glycosyltransferase family 4 protein [Nitrospiraceae bacterium]|nr:glycosyltransferase family 4 protein [Nitrospiraceae bacterium]
MITRGPGYFMRALDLYKGKRNLGALKCSLLALMREPFRKAPWLLLMKSFTRLVLPAPFVNALKIARRPPDLAADYIHFIRLRRRLAGATRDIGTPGGVRREDRGGNILFIVRDMGLGGVSRVNLDIIRGMGEGPFRFHIAATSPANNVWRGQFEACCRTVIVPEWEMKDFGVWGRYFCDIVRRLDIQTAVVSNSYVGYHVLPRLKEQFPRLKTLDILHMEGMWGTTETSKWTIPYLDKRIVISNSLKDFMTKEYENFGVAREYAERLETIYNGIDLSRYRPEDRGKGRFKARFGIPPDAKIISFIGRFSLQKLPCLFVDIANAILERNPGPGLKFVMAGDGEDMGKVKEAIAKYGMTDRFILPGMLGEDEVALLLADTYLLLVASLNEGIPLVIFEAMLMKVPVISTDVGAIHEIVEDKRNGRLISRGGDLIGSYAGAVFDFLSGRLDYDAMAVRAGDTIAQRYSRERMARAYAASFTRLRSSQ